MGGRAVRVARELVVLVALGALVLTGHLVLERTARGDTVVTRPACAELYVDGVPSGVCQNWPDAPVPAPTSSYDGRAPHWGPDRRPIEQNPECWITNPGWPRCSEGTDT